MPQHPTLLLNLHNRDVGPQVDEMRAIAELTEVIRKTKGHKIASEFLIKSIGVTCNPLMNEEYYREALDYNLGILFAHLDEPELSVEYLTRSGVHPAAGSDLVFSDHIESSLHLHTLRVAAAARGMPSILLASMPRSGSASLTRSIGAAMDVPVARVCAGRFPGFILVPRWLNSFSPGGAVAHDHFGASTFNLQILKDAGWQDLFVLIRDPRAGALSAVKLQSTLAQQSYSTDYIEKRLLDAFLRSFLPWLDQWIDASKTAGMRIHWIRFKESTKDMAGMVRKILRVFQTDYPALGQILSGPIQPVAENLGRGDDDAWRSVVSESGRRRLWEAMSPELIELLALEP